MEIRYGMEKDFERAKKIWGECFVDSEEEQEYYFKNLYDRHKYLVLEENDEIKASLHENFYKLSIAGNKLDSFYIVGVAVSPEYRGKGYMGAILKSSLKGAMERGLNFIYLSPINPDIYRRYGFEYVTEIEEYTMLCEDIVYDKIEKAFDIKKVELNSEDELYKDMISVYTEKMKDFFLYVERDEKYFRNWVREIKSDNGEVYLFYLDGIVQGYLAFYKRSGELIVREAFGLNKRVYESILAFIKSFKEYYPNLKMKSPIRENLNFYFKNQKKIKKESYPYIMGRVVNPMELLKSLSLKGINLKFMLTDSIILENNGVYELKEDGEVKFLKEEVYDIKMDIADFSQLIFGYLTLKELVFMEKIEVKNEDVLKKLEEKRMFSLKKNYIQDYQ